MSPQTTTPEARARRRAHERHVRSEVRRFSSCLSSLGTTQRRYLSLRAGLNGPPKSRGDAADEVGIPRSEARDIERRGLRRLRSACGGGGGGSTTAQTLSHTTTHMPTFQPTSLLVATGGSTPTEFVDQKELGRGKQQVKGESASSSPAPSHNEGHPEAAVPTKPVADASSGGIGAAWIAVLAALALMAAVTMLVLRGRRGGHGETVTAAPAATGVPIAPPPAPARQPEPQPAPEPEPTITAGRTYPATPVPPQAGPHGRDYHRAARPAAMIASGILSFAARELMRRRRGGRRR